MISDQQLAEWQALCDGATPGPWTDGWCDRDDEDLGREVCDDTGLRIALLEQDGRAMIGNSQFLAAARTALPALIEEVRRLRELVAEVGESGVVFDDERLRWLEIQIDRDTWERLPHPKKEASE